MKQNENGTLVPLLIMMTTFGIAGLIGWAAFLGGALYPEDRVITVASVGYHSHVGQYTEIRIAAEDGSEYEFGMQKHMFDNPMYANINNGWHFPKEQTIEAGGSYKITIWRSIFGGYAKDPFSNWNPNPEISKITRID